MRLDGHKPVQKYMPAGPHSAGAEEWVPGMARATVLEPPTTAEVAAVEVTPAVCDRPAVVLGGRVLCNACFDRQRHSHVGASVAIVGPWANDESHDGYHCGDPVPIPKWTQPSANPPGYRAAGKMGSCLPGRSKYSGALYSRVVGRAEDGSLIVEDAPESVTGSKRGHGRTKVVIGEGEAVASRQNGAMAKNRIQAQMATPKSPDDMLPIVVALDERFECGECGYADEDRVVVARHIYAHHPAYGAPEAVLQAPVTAESDETAAEVVVDQEPSEIEITGVSSDVLAVLAATTEPQLDAVLDEPSGKAPSGFKFGGFINNPEYADDLAHLERVERTPARTEAPKVRITLAGRAVPPTSVEAPPKPEPRPQPRPRPTVSQDPPAGTQNVTLRQLIEVGIMPAPIEVERSYLGQQFTATVQTDGRILFDAKVYDAPSSAAEAANTLARPEAADHRTNGWKFWHVRKDGQLVSLDALRRQFGGAPVARQNRTEARIQAPVKAESPVRTLSEVMDAGRSERHRNRVLPDAIAKTVDEAESFMWAFLGREEKPAGPDQGRIAELEGLVERRERRIFELDQMVRERDEALREATKEIARLAYLVDTSTCTAHPVPVVIEGVGREVVSA